MTLLSKGTPRPEPCQLNVSNSHQNFLLFVTRLFVLDAFLHVLTIFYSKSGVEKNTDFVALRDEAANMHEQAMSRDAGRHEVMIQMAKDV